MSVTRHHFLRASAGTGKTYQLVEAYVGHIIERKLSPTQVVAITFTKKAAAELRARIRLRLIERGVDRKVLDELGRAPIANFHGLALQMLQGFGIHAGFTDVPTIMGELGEDERMFRIACEEAWFGARSESRDALTAVSKHIRFSARGPQGAGLVDAMWEAVAKAREEDDPRPLWERFATHDARAAQREVHDRWLRLRETLKANRLTYGKKTQTQVGDFLLHKVPALSDDMSAWADAWQAANEELKGARLNDEAGERKELADLIEEPLAEHACGALVPHLRELMRSACERYTALKRETRSADFPDLIEQTSQALMHDAELHARVRERYKVVLVDEAQDTNASQRRFVRLIAGLEGAVRDGEPATLFVVGDRKQAIYTFRGADPEAFNRFADDLAKLGCQMDELKVSRRSSAGIVAGVNHLGAGMLTPYEALEALPGKAAAAGPALTWLTPNVEPEANRPARAEAEARAAARLIRGAIDAGAEPSSFAILLRAMGKAQKFTRSLAALGIPSVISGGSGFYDQTEIVDLMALLTWLVDGEAYLDAAVAMR
ncbi:MAG TPA: UvrD-helicase domain-containing protein, partial [Myxococcota bacterium]|nr:UvrD-helicase domain-containing protein [Myxococcota bacterium]